MMRCVGFVLSAMLSHPGVRYFTQGTEDEACSRGVREEEHTVVVVSLFFLLVLELYF